MKTSLISLLFFVSPAVKPADDVYARFTPPATYQRKATGATGFGSWLSRLPLKPAGAHTLTYNGDVARTDTYTAAIVDMSIGRQDLQQCADAVMRLRAEYLYQSKRYDAIAFNFTSGFRCDYLHYANGYRYMRDKWVKTSAKNYSYATFLQYMNLVFAYAGTLSLEKELIKVNDTNDLRAGDIFIHGGSPGHCFIVLDVVENASYQRKFLLAQSFMPAQNIQVLQQGGDAWFRLEKTAQIPYGQLVDLKYLRRFKN